MKAHRRAGFELAVLIVMVASISSVVVTGSAASAWTPGPGPAFTCSVPTYFLSQGTQTASNPTKTQLYTSTAEMGATIYTALGSPQPEVYNALGFDPTNQYLYATQLNGNVLYQIDDTGTANSLGTISGYTAVRNQPADGAFDASGNYWITGGNGSNTAYEIDVNSTPPKVINSLALSQSWQPIDFTLNGGFLWGLYNRTLYRLNLTNGTVSTFIGPSGIEWSGNYGAAWTYDNGNLGFSNNADGTIYQVSVTNPSSNTPTFALLDSSTGPVAGQSNDGATCEPVAPPTTDLSIVKSGPATVAAGGPVTWTLTVKNNGPDNSQGFAVDDTVPSGYTNVAATGCAVSGTMVTCAGPVLANGASTTITISADAPSTSGTCTTNTATVTADQVDPNSANNSSSVQTCTLGKINIVKSASPGSYTAAGQVIHYSYLVTNGSTSSMTGLSVSDNVVPSVSCPSTTLAAGASETCTATYTTTTADVSAGSRSNTGTAAGTINGGQVTASSTLTIPYSALALAKTAVTTGYSAAGQTLSYDYLVTNSGTSTVNAIAVSDNKVAPANLTCPQSSLAAGASETCIGTYVTTAADRTAGSVTNTATATGIDSTGTAVTSNQSHATVSTKTSSLSLTKSSTTSGYSAAGQPLDYDYLVKNTGTTTINSIAVSDNKVAPANLTCPQSSLSAGASETCTGTYRTLQADVDAGSVTNTATASGTDQYGLAVTSNQSQATVPAKGTTSSLSLTKTATVGGYSAAGQTLSYNYLVTNTGTTTIDSIAVSDNKVAPANLTCPQSSLAPAASETCTGTYVTLQADVDAGSVTNTATATGKNPSNTPVTSNQSTATVVANGAASSLSLVKSTTTSGYSAAGQTLSYDYLVTNTGTTTVSAIAVSDNLIATVSCPDASLAPGASETCTGTYTTTQADVDIGHVTNIASATGTDPSNGTVTSNQSTVTVDAAGTSSSLALTKSATTPGYGAAGQTLSYDYLVTNTGTTTVSSIAVSDNVIPSVSCPHPTLAPGLSETCTGSYTTTQTDVDTGSVTNTATASGTNPSDTRITSNPSTVTVPASEATSSLSLTKSVNAATPGYSAAGRTLSYDYLVTNTGTTTISSIAVSDNLIPSVSCPHPTLAPGASETCTGSYTTTQTDVDTGSVTNTATASGTNPSDTPITSNPSTVTVPARGATSSLSLTKSTTTPGYRAAGDTLAYNYRVTNTGTTTISSVAVSDNLIPSVSCPQPTLAPRASETCTGSYTTTQPDVDTGSVTNTATASGTNPSDTPITSNPSTVTVPASEATSSLSLTKSVNAATPSYSAAGQTLSYDYLVTNTGTVTIDDIGVTDTLVAPANLTCPDASLAPGGSETCTGTYTTTQTDVDAGSVTNTANATGTDAHGNPVVSPGSTVTVPASGTTSSLSLTKSTISNGFSKAGNSLSYDYLVTNTGTTTISAIAVSDNVIPSVSCPDASLAPGASETCTGSYTVTQADVDAGQVTNTATATGTDPHDNPITSNPSTVTVPAKGATSALSLVKATTTSGYSEAGAYVFYDYLVTNTGTTTINEIAISDNLVVPGNLYCPDASLAPAAVETCTGTYTTTQADVDAGQVTNTATATGTDPSNGTVTSNQSTVTVDAAGTSSSLALTKFTTTPGYGAAAQTLDYDYLVTNTGTTTVSSIAVSDSLIASVGCPDASLAPGDSETCTGTYTTTQADVDTGQVTNTATATGVDAYHDPVTSNPSTLTVPAKGTTSSLSLAKTAATPSYSASGQTLDYDYLVTNTGTTTISSIAVSDNLIAPVSCPPASLAPGDSETCTGSYTTTQADVDIGHVTNTATATGTDAHHSPVTSNQSTASVPARGTTSSLSLTKSALTSGYSVPGQTLNYNYRVTNTGTTTISSIAVSDNVIPSVSCPHPTLAPGVSETCTGSYTTTQTDVDTGSVTNTATATGTDPSNAPVASNQSTATVPATTSASISIDKTTNGSDGLNIAVGAAVTWAYQVTNSGNVTLTHVTVTDNQVAASAINCGGGSNVIPSLAPGSTVTCTATGTAVAGSYANTGTATGTTPASGSVQASDDSGYYGVQDLSVTTTATPTLTRTYDWSVAKSATPPLIEQLTGGTATAGFEVTATQAGHTDSLWHVTGTITVTNPNSDEAITANVSDALNNGGTCLVNGSASDPVTVAASSFATVDYACTYASAPTSANGTNTATATWDRSATSTPHTSATGQALFAFGAGPAGNPTSVDRCILVTDAFDGGPATTLGTDCVGVDPVTETFTYTQPVTVPMRLTKPAVAPGTTVTPTTVSFTIPSAGNWGLVLTTLPGHTLAYVKGTSGTLSVRVPVSDTCQYQYDVLKNGQFYEGERTTIPRCGGQPNCLTDPNTATLLPTGQSASASVEVCGAAATGAQSMTSWKTTLQGVITGGASTGGVCNSATWLRTYLPFQDLSKTAKCTAVAAYVSKVIGAGQTSMPDMLKAQMLATALNVYFSSPILGGDKIAAPAPIGGLSVDLTKICNMVDSADGSTCPNTFTNTAADGHNAWGGAPKLTVAELLAYAAGRSNVGGTMWYVNVWHGNVTAPQQDAKNTFDAINNLAAFVP